jgi:molybdate transport system substrate-binding protein
MTRVALLKLIFSLTVFSISLSVQANDLRIAAATNLRYVLPEIVQAFERQYGFKVSVSYAASGTLTTQISHGAPFNIFLSANPDYIKRLQQKGFADEKAFTFAYGQLALFSAHHAMFDVVKGIASIETALDKQMLKKVAIANPQHAPYGQAAKAELEKHDLWQAVQPHLLIAENASQATQFTLSSRSSVGFIPYTHALQPAVSKLGQYIKLDVALPQQAVIIKPKVEIADIFLQFLQKQEVNTILQKHGFVMSEGN